MDTSLPVQGESVYSALDGGIHHAKCSQRMVLTARDSQELHLSCPTCAESVRLPVSTMAQISVAT
jgi:hypothetical protein